MLQRLTIIWRIAPAQMIKNSLYGFIMHLLAHKQNNLMYKKTEVQKITMILL